MTGSRTRKAGRTFDRGVQMNAREGACPPRERRTKARGVGTVSNSAVGFRILPGTALGFNTVQLANA